MVKYTGCFLLVIFCLERSVQGFNDNDDAIQDCRDACRSLHRHCYQPPNMCGSCFSAYTETEDQTCYKTDPLTEDSSIDKIANDVLSSRNQNSQNNKEDSTTGMEDSSGVNLAAAGKSGAMTHKQAPYEPVLGTPLFIAVVAGCSVAGLVGLVVAGVCWYRLQKNVKAASEAEYPAYGVTGPTKERVGSPGDRKLAQSAQMYHYQHQKQQMIALEKANGEMKHDGSDEDSEEENEEGDYTVYECPGLAPTGEMEVKNPLFSEETPVTPTPNGGESSEHGHK